MAKGAWAGKVCGAGGGGCVFVLAPPDATGAVRASWTRAGAMVLDAVVDPTGVVVTEEE
jgi:D-glycero-alpha-D-manno-heptose-7-phosphate kinase